MSKEVISSLPLSATAMQKACAPFPACPSTCVQVGPGLLLSLQDQPHVDVARPPTKAQARGPPSPPSLPAGLHKRVATSPNSLPGEVFRSFFYPVINFSSCLTRDGPRPEADVDRAAPAVQKGGGHQHSHHFHGTA